MWPHKNTTRQVSCDYAGAAPDERLLLNDSGIVPIMCISL